MGRDRTARHRIRRHLATLGPLEDGQGLATKRLKEAIGYQGSPVAFIQLVAAMERDGEISRDIRGKRTYRIGSGEEASAAPVVVAVPEVDYDELARSIVRELTTAAGAAENKRVAEERDAFARQLELARLQLAELRGAVHQD